MYMNNFVYIHNNYVGTSPMIWKDIKKGAHTITVQAYCPNGKKMSITKRMFDFIISK